MELPTVRSIHLCEQVIIEEVSRNASLINTFTRWAWKGPDETVRCVLYCVLSGSMGTIPLDLAITPLATDLDVFTRTLPFTFLDPVTSHRLVYRFKELRFDELGAYEVTLTVRGEPLANSRFEIFMRDS